MRAGKAYITSLGTTGLLVASSVMLLVVVGALIAYEGWPTGSDYSTPEIVAVGGGDPERVVAKRRLARERRLAERRRARARANRARPSRRAERSTPRDGDGDRVISDLPAPDSRPGTLGGGGGGSGGRGAEPAPANGPAPGGGGGGSVSGQVGGAVSTVNPQAGGTISETGGALSGAIGQVVPTPQGVGVAP
jgi:hypothetical protein